MKYACALFSLWINKYIYQSIYFEIIFDSAFKYVLKLDIIFQTAWYLRLLNLNS